MTRWSVEALRNLRNLEAVFPRGKVMLFPTIRNWGDAVKWDARVYPTGAAGVLPVNRESLLSIGVSEGEVEDMLDKVERALAALRKLYPAAIPELVGRLKELESAARVSLPAAE